MIIQPGTLISNLLGVLIHVSSIAPEKRTTEEYFFLKMVEKQLKRLHDRIPTSLRETTAQVQVTLGQLVPPGDPLTRSFAPQREKEDE